jgi:hypothetical protein
MVFSKRTVPQQRALEYGNYMSCYQLSVSGSQVQGALSSSVISFGATEQEAMRLLRARYPSYTVRQIRIGGWLVARSQVTRLHPSWSVEGEDAEGKSESKRQMQVTGEDRQLGEVTHKCSCNRYRRGAHLCYHQIVFSEWNKKPQNRTTTEAAL